MNEQWKASGDCEKCRKKSYCSKPCKVHKERVSKECLKKVLDTGLSLEQLKIPDDLLTKYRIDKDLQELKNEHDNRANAVHLVGG